MNLLLDTHTFIWFIEDHPRLSPPARVLIEEPANTILVSTATLWEMAIKISLGKLSLSQPFDQFIPAQLHGNQFTTLGITFAHVRDVATLPFHHRDPFDRLLVSQCRTESLPLISDDTVLDQYGVTRLW